MYSTNLEEYKRRWDAIVFEKRQLSIELLKAKYFLKTVKDISLIEELESNVRCINSKIKVLDNEAQQIDEIAQLALQEAII